MKVSSSILDAEMRHIRDNAEEINGMNAFGMRGDKTILAPFITILC